jgi:hypothetical protein
VPEIFVCALALEAAKTMPAKTRAILSFVKVVSSSRFVANGAANVRRPRFASGRNPALCANSSQDRMLAAAG